MPGEVNTRREKTVDIRDIQPYFSLTSRASVRPQRT